MIRQLEPLVCHLFFENQVGIKKRHQTLFSVAGGGKHKRFPISNNKSNEKMVEVLNTSPGGREGRAGGYE